MHAGRRHRTIKTFLFADQFSREQKWQYSFIFQYSYKYYILYIAALKLDYSVDVRNIFLSLLFEMSSVLCFSVEAKMTDHATQANSTWLIDWLIGWEGMLKAWTLCEHSINVDFTLV